MNRLRNIGRLFTGTPAGVIEDAAVILMGEEIAWCGKHGEEPHELMESITDEHDCEGGLVTAGLIDAHTHPVYAGDRMAEVAMRSAGASYEQVAKAGGGIRATVKATREEPIRSLEVATAKRLWCWLEGGATNPAELVKKKRLKELLAS
jgi:imidazolonepropionase